ncbi:aldolase [Streptomyces sp. CBMA29]|uniref:class II aldolase/adducin family protein n=1 Tax=Streptomyces sp. CBMA29 TaxID=1896314 RepID=UPI001661E100|nr:aldolase [Streptomyces sp. CBMA29]MBD0734312.1 hypothetical protein [Streptomyces sp. CBMA29]
MTPTPAGDLVAYAKLLSDRGLAHGRTGNLSVRTADGVLVTPTGAALGSLTEDGLAHVDGQGARLSGPPPTKELLLHLAVYRARPELRAVVHLHSHGAVAVSLLRETDPSDAIPPLTPYYVMRVGSLPVVPYFRPGDPAMAEAVGPLLTRSHCLLLAHHGTLAAGVTLADAAEAAEEIEATARLWLAVRSHDISTLTSDQIGALRPADPNR